MSDEPDLQVRRFLRRMELEPKVHEIVALTVAMCKAEVEAVIGTDLLVLKDGGSPWSRALLKTLDLLSERVGNFRKGNYHDRENVRRDGQRVE